MSRLSDRVKMVAIKPLLYVTRLFSSPDAIGSLTGIVLCEENPDMNSFQGIARRLGFPDTGFLNEKRSDISWKLFSYSPFESMRFCTQTLLSAAAIRQLCSSSAPSFSFSTENGIYTVENEADDREVWWLPAEIQDANPAPLELIANLSGFGIDVNVLHSPPCIAGVGRRRIYLQLQSEDELLQFSIDAREVNEWCKNHELTALCVFVRLESDRIRLRVFTTSLGGEEDIATGGAALGIMALEPLLHLDLDNRITVYQGHSEVTCRGEILLKKGQQGELPRIGSRVDVLCRGALAF